MSQDIKITGYHGINNLLSSDRVKGLPTRDDPLVDLSAAQNVDLDDTGKPSVRLGYSLFQTIAGAHDGFAHNGVCVYVKGGTLYRFYPATKVSEPLVGVGIDSRMRYWGHGERIWFTNGAVLGEVKDGAARLFAMPTNATEFKESMPPGQAIAFFRGRLYIFTDDVLCMSDDTHLNRMDTETSFKQFPDNGVLIAPVSTPDGKDFGLYAATNKAVYYASGGHLLKMDFKKVAGCGGKDIPVKYESASIVKGLQVEGVYPVFVTNDGVCMGLPQGQLYNLTEEKYVMPAGTTGASMMRDINGQKHYIAAFR